MTVQGITLLVQKEDMWFTVLTFVRSCVPFCLALKNDFFF